MKYRLVFITLLTFTSYQAQAESGSALNAQNFIDTYKRVCVDQYGKYEIIAAALVAEGYKFEVERGLKSYIKNSDSFVYQFGQSKRTGKLGHCSIGMPYQEDAESAMVLYLKSLTGDLEPLMENNGGVRITAFSPPGAGHAVTITNTRGKSLVASYFNIK